MKNAFKLLAKGVFVPLGLLAAASTVDAGILKKIIGSGTRTLIISNKEMRNIMKIVKPLEDSSLLIKGVSQTIGNKTKKQRGEFLGMLYPKCKLNGKYVSRQRSNQSWREFVMHLIL